MQPASTSDTLDISSSSVSRHTMRRSGSIDDGINRAVWDARIVFILCLISVAGILGFVAHWVVAGAESELAVTQFESTADRVLTEAST